MLRKLRLLLLPFAGLYGLIVEVIKLSYKLGWRISRRTEVASIVVGNLSTGGTGKTPHVEYVIGHLGPYHKVALLSRGYGRKTRGFKLVNAKDSAEAVGDEPLQICLKYPEIPIAVCEKRVDGMNQILKLKPETQMLIFDDAMQHWPVRADYYIMLTTYRDPFFNDYPLPAGNLREFRFNYKRANMLIVSKCPSTLSDAEAREFLQKLSPQKQQKVFFSYFKYGSPYIYGEKDQTIPLEQLESREVLLISGVANPEIIETDLRSRGANVQLLRYADHHQFRQSDWINILQKWQQLKSKSENCLLLTTEKDATRLAGFLDASIPLYVLPVEVEISFNQAPALQRALVEVMYKKKGYPTT